MKWLCRIIGHKIEGPYANTDSNADMLEPGLYWCPRCLETIRFAKQYPNGFRVYRFEDGEEVTMTGARPMPPEFEAMRCDVLYGVSVKRET